MMFISKEFILEDKTKMAVRFILYESNHDFIWRIEDIQYKKPRQRDWRFLKSSWNDEYNYRLLSLTERERYDYKRFADFCGEEILKAAYQDVYEQLKPSILRSE